MMRILWWKNQEKEQENQQQFRRVHDLYNF